MIHRTLTDRVRRAAQEFPAIAVVGPRQSGKTTFVQYVFEKHAYVSLEDFDTRAAAQEDPRGFLRDRVSSAGIILDEIQHVPQLLSYIQTIIDAEKKKGFFIITGSQNLLVNQSITQTLAGRMAIVTLFPFSINELDQAKLLPSRIEELVVTGTYPHMFVEPSATMRWYDNYIRGYVERDVRQVTNITDLNAFQRFMRLCAGRIGQVVNLSSLGDDCGISHTTVKAWLSLLEASYVVFLLYPYYKNFGKRLIKSPKIYFVDTGVACSLLNITTANELTAHYLRGGLVESLMISDFLKQFYNRDQTPALYFWRDHAGNEVDCLIERALTITPIEIKAGSTVTSDYFKQFDYLKTIGSFPETNNYVVYGGEGDQSRTKATVLGWKSAGNLVDMVMKD
jgi:predicted AAA+ superfamily ATPase